MLGYVDQQIEHRLDGLDDFRILRYRDDYRIFANSDEKAEKVLQVVSDELRTVGMKLGVSKTFMSTNVIKGSLKPDKLAGINLQDLGNSNAQTIQKQLLRLHSFGQEFPNSGALRRLVFEFFKELSGQEQAPSDLEVQVAIATDIAYVSPNTFPAVAAILSHLIALAPGEDKSDLWDKVHRKMKRIPYNGYLEIWLQRVTQPALSDMSFNSDEPICRIVNGDSLELWKNDWISSNDLKKALDVQKLIVSSVEDAEEVVQQDEIALFCQNTWAY